MRLIQISCARLSALLVLAFCVGCGGGGAELHPVKGRVLLGKSPITPKQGETAVIEFYPDKDGGNTATVNPRSVIVADGSYELKTGDKLGAPAGKWLAVVTYQIEPDPNGKDPYAPPKKLIATMHSSVSTTPHRREIPQANPVEYDIIVTK